MVPAECFGAKCFGATTIPSDFQQCWRWCEFWIPAGKKFHSCGIAAICWAIWKSRNIACFENKLIKNPLEIICYICALLQYWSGLFAEVDQDQLVEGANLMLKVAKEVLAVQTARQVDLLLLDQGQGEDDRDSCQ